MLWKICKWFLFLLDAEVAHRVTLFLIRVGICLKRIPLHIVSGTSRESLRPKSDTPLHRVFDLEFLSPLGLAAGFDKNAEILSGLPALGFGFVEVGTVTPRPQPGNELPRLFRDPARSSLFNRMGFNGLGASMVAANIAESKNDLPELFRIGVNIGKNKDTLPENAQDDYYKAALPFEGLADYLVINVSSPNTPGLRSLQTIEALKPIVGRVAQLISGWKKAPPLLLKLAPELGHELGEELVDLIHGLEPEGISGWVLTNTLGGSLEVKRSSGNSFVTGGWSGSVLTDLARKNLEIARKVTSRPILSVGGIMTVDEAMKRIALGANLIQIYSGWVFNGPRFPRQIVRRLESQF